MLLNEPSGRSNELKGLRRIEGEDKYALMTPSQIGVARLDAEREGTQERAEANRREDRWGDELDSGSTMSGRELSRQKEGWRKDTQERGRKEKRRVHAAIVTLTPSGGQAYIYTRETYRQTSRCYTRIEGYVSRGCGCVSRGGESG